MMHPWRRIVIAGLSLFSFFLLFAPPALAQNGTVSGSVNAATGQPLEGIGVELHDASGYDYVETDSSGSYSFTAPAGSYYVRTDNFQGFIDELYNDIPCFRGCDLTSGASITVTAGQTTGNINFMLAAGGRISGTVTNESNNAPLQGVEVNVFTTSGHYATHGYTDAQGDFISGSGLPAGSYYVGSYNSASFFDELYNNVPCPTCPEYLSGNIDSIDVTGGTQVAATAGQTTGNIDFALAPGGGISGTITNQSTGTPVPGISVAIYDASGDYVTYGYTDSQGFYISLAALPTGSYFMETYNSAGFLNELYDNIPCQECDQRSGTPVAVTAGQTTGNKDFALLPGGRISGTVTNQSTGNPVPDVSVYMYNASGNPVSYGSTNAQGIYFSEAGLPTGSYYVKTYQAPGFIDELYNDIACMDCDVTTGTPVAVTTPNTTSNIDFALGSGGRISGTVTNTSTSAAVPNVTVNVHRVSGSSYTTVTSGSTNAQGQYTTSGGLPSGTYFVSTSNSAGLLNEVFDNILCQNCDPTAVGTPVVVTAGQEITNINFALAAGGRISGRVTNQATGAPLPNADVAIYTIGGTWVTWGVSDAQGNYVSADGLPAGSYLVRTYNTGSLIPEAYDNIPCVNCDYTTGTPVAVIAGQTTTNVNFALSAGGRISGTVTNASTTQVVPNVWIDLYDANGRYLAAVSTNGSGVYTSPGLPAGTYFALTGSNSAGLIDELFDNIACLGSCSAVGGTPIVVTAGATATASFALSPGGRIAGRITNASSGAAIPGVEVWVYNTAGVFVQFGYTDSLGNYATSGLPSGSYFLRTYNESGFIDEVHANVVCLSCDVVASGTGVVVAAPNSTTVDFALAPGGSITGTVTDSSGNPLQFIDIDVYGSNGSDLTDGSNDSWLTWATTNAQGVYNVVGLTTGNFYVGTSNSAGYINEIYNDVACFGCNATVGARVAVTAGQQTPGINFTLARGGIVTGTVTNAAGGANLAGIYVCVTTTATGEGESCGQSNASGVYSISGLPAGTYYARTYNLLGYIDELYDNFLCLSCSTSHGTPVTVTVGSTTSDVSFALIGGGRIGGRVTNATTGAAVPDADVYIYTANGAYLTNGYTDDTGRYTTYGGLPAGTYYARAFATGYVGKLYNDIHCPGYCPETTGDGIDVTVGNTTTGIDFALVTGGRVTGRVTDAAAPAGSDGLEGVRVNVYDSVSGRFLGSATTIASGAYAVVGLPSGTYVAETSNNIGFIDEIYDDVRCVTCSVTNGGTFTVTAGGTTSGVNFALDRGGRITGTVTSAGSGTVAQHTGSTNPATEGFSNQGIASGGPISNDGGFDAWQTTGGAGSAFLYRPINYATAFTQGWRLSSRLRIVSGTGATNLGLNTSTDRPRFDVHVRTVGADAVVSLPDSISTAALSFTLVGRGNTWLLLDLVYDPATQTASLSIDGVQRLSGYAGWSDFRQNYGVLFGGASVTANFNFVRFQTPASGTPIRYVDLSVYDSLNRWVGSAWTDVDGRYSTNGLPPGQYFVQTTYNYEGYINQLYQNLPCVSCTPSSGMPVTVTGTETTANIDFSLASGGTISGRVATPGGVGLEDVTVSVYDGNNTFMASAYTAVDGTYAVTGLASGVYYAKTSNLQGDIDLLYQNVTCLSCGIVGGTPITVTAGSITPNVDFTLADGGGITGTVTGPAGAGLGDIFVQVFSGNGQFLESARTDAQGRYRSSVGLSPGTYFLRTSNTLGFVDELYNNTACIGCNPTTGTPVLVTGTAVTSGIDFSLAGAGVVTGTITNTGGSPLAGITVSVYSAAGSLVTSGVANAIGVYKTGAVPNGSYYVRTSNTSGYINQVHRARECLDCNPSTGTAVQVVTGQATSGIDFVLRRGGRVAGTVTTGAGGGIPGVTVTIITTGGETVASGTTDAAGRYVSLNGLPTGTYYARTSNNGGFVDEIYDNLTCTWCATAIGTPIAVTAGVDATGVNFSLSSGGRIGGVVADAGTLEPIAGARVEVYTATGVLVTTTVSGSAGLYLTGGGLRSGRYFVRASSPLGYVSEVYDNRECAACAPITGTPVQVTFGQSTLNVDFRLERGGRIAGTITEAGSGQALRDIEVSIYNGNNNLVASARTDAAGRYTSGFGLPTGTYFARTNNTLGFVDKIYSDTVCLLCTPNAGTGIAVTVGLVTSNIDFQLSRGARMTGSVIETGTNLPLEGVTVSVYNINNKLVASGVTDSSGQYQTTGGLFNGTYFARTTNDQGYIDKLFDTGICLACDPTRGTPIQVTGPTVVPGVNFFLSPGGRIGGTITAETTGAPIGNVRVAIHNAAGAFVGASFSNSAGEYITTGLPPGKYRIRSLNRLGFVDERYNDFPCAPCVMTEGTAITVSGAVTVGGTSFALAAGGLVSGWVTDAASRAPLAGVTVSFTRMSDGVFVGRSSPSDASGYYAISLPVGTYSAEADPVQGYAAHVTPGLQTAAIGNVTVEVGVETPGVQFPLPVCTPPSITPATLPMATAGLAYSAGLSAQGGNASSYAFKIANGALPPGLSLSGAGVISGTPSELGTANFTVAVTDAAQCSATQTYAQFTCGITLAETSATFASGGGSRTVTVAANSTSCGWSATTGDAWITITAGSGSGAGTLGFAVAANTATSARTGTITVGSQTYTVTQNGAEAQKPLPVGAFDTPLEGATVTGSIAVTGWTLDDAGIDRVEIWRDLAAGETTPPFNAPGHPGHGKVFIDRGTFVRGARPDVAALYPTHPNNDRAGWGYLMLTQGLANQGNGPFTLYAFAFDVDGQFTRLCAAAGPTPGSCASVTKTIVANNAVATKPFGGIDTPAYGAIVSGGVWNYGWALTPNPNAADGRSCTIPDGNVYVGIDSQPIVPVRYGETRTDIATVFSGFSNGSAAGGAYYVDTTALGNGDHQIGWYVVDNCGRADGIGSRFFSVLNGVNITTEAAPRVGLRALAAASDDSPILVRHDDVTRASFADDRGVHVIRLAQGERIEVALPPFDFAQGVLSDSRSTGVDGSRYRGGEIVDGAEKALPLGSSLDAERGIFYWAPAPAFLGSYDLIFVASDRSPVRMRVVIEPAVR